MNVYSLLWYLFLIGSFVGGLRWIKDRIESPQLLKRHPSGAVHVMLNSADFLIKVLIAGMIGASSYIVIYIGVSVAIFTGALTHDDCKNLQEGAKCAIQLNVDTVLSTIHPMVYCFVGGFFAVMGNELWNASISAGQHLIDKVLVLVRGKIDEKTNGKNNGKTKR